MSSKKPLEDIILRLRVEGGRPSFEEAVADALSFLSFQVETIPDTQAESDLIVKAYLPQNPYFVIVECSAVREGSFVGYQKLGQIRGNAPKYFLQYGKELPSYYKIIVGRPAFSGDTKKHALNDVVLLTVDILIDLLDLHNIYQFSQDELRLIFETKGEVDEDRLAELARPYLKNLKTCALVMMGLLIEPTRNPDQRRKEWLDINQLVGRVAILSWFLDVGDITPTDIIRAINDLSSPMKSIVQLSEDGKLKLTSIPFEVVTEKMGRQGVMFCKILSDFRLKAISMKAPKPKEPRSVSLPVDLKQKNES